MKLWLNILFVLLIQCIVVKSLVLHIFLYLVIVQSGIFQEHIIKEGNWQDNSKSQEETWQDHCKEIMKDINLN